VPASGHHTGVIGTATRTVEAMSDRPTAGVSTVAAAAAALIVLQLMVRAWLAFGGYFYWDDLILIGRAGTQPLLSTGYLFTDHDGHVMPAAFLLGGVITRLAPLVWIWPAVSLMVLQLIASLALLRTLNVILGWRPVLLVPLCFALFTPLGVPAFAWWAAALNYLPMMAALAWVCGDAILLVRTGQQRYAVTGTLAYLGGLMFFEKAAVIPFVAFGVAALLSSYPAAFHVVQWAGAAYLAWLGAYMLLAKPGAASPIEIRPRQFLRQAMVITLLNPKAILFYMAFFPLFVDPVQQQGLLTYGFMAATIAALTFLYGLSATLLTYIFAERLRASPRVGHALEKLAGVFLIGFGVKLVVSQ
jgi:threonine/homoserine/homoserine lactone efflux protein